MATEPTPEHKDIVQFSAENIRNVEATNQIVRINGVKHVVPVNGMRNIAREDVESVNLPYMVCEAMRQAGIEAYTNITGTTE